MPWQICQGMAAQQQMLRTSCALGQRQGIAGAQPKHARPRPGQSAPGTVKSPEEASQAVRPPVREHCRKGA